MTRVGPVTEVFYSQVHEDPLLELRVIDRLLALRRRPLRVAIVASGGCTALSLLAHREVSAVHAVDLNPAQLHVTEFKRQALLHVPLADQWTQVGASPGGTEAERQGHYAMLRPHMPEATRAFWDARPEAVAFGVNRIGRFEQLLRAVASELRALGLEPLVHPRDVVLDARFREAFERAFDPEALETAFGAEAVQNSRLSRFSDHYAEAFSRAMWRFLPSENYFLHQAWADAYDVTRPQVPPYLQAETQDSIRELGADRLTLAAGDFGEAIADQGPFDLIAASNLTDWMPSSGLHGFFDGVRRSLAPGGALLARRLMGDHGLEAMMSEHLEVDGPFGKSLWLSDRSFLYSEVAVGFRP
jgi:S-adenosylmethionine-diacylglycerol 3-amino-3-carboxypropyl transferase